VFNVTHIVSLIEKSGRSIYSVEKSLGFGNGAIRRWAKNSPSISKLYALSNYLNVSVAELIDETGSSLPDSVLDLARRFDKLDDDGQALVRAELIRAEERLAAKSGRTP
jgi:transcriptional regulator with XRE-family HTH domain